MSGEIQVAYQATGRTLYALVRNNVGQAWRTDTHLFESYATANLANYAVALTEQGTASRYYAGTFPGQIAAGVYAVTAYDQGGGGAAEGDTLAGYAAQFQWSGSVIQPLYRVPVTDSNGATFTYVTPPTTGAIATAVLTDTTGGDLGTAGSLGYLAGHAPGWYTAPTTPPTAAAVATQVWTDLTASADFAAANSIGALLKTNLDAAVSSRLAAASYTTPPTAAAIATTILTDTVSGDISTVGSLGYLIGHAPGWYTAPTTPPTAAAIATQVWTDLTASADFSTASSIGALLVANVNATISSRSTYAGADTAGTTTLLSRIGSALTIVENAGVTVGTNGDKSGYSLLSTGLNAVLIDGKALPAALQYIAASTAGKVSGAGSGTETFLGLDGATTRLTITVDVNGNRSNVVYG